VRPIRHPRMAGTVLESALLVNSLHARLPPRHSRRPWSPYNCADAGRRHAPTADQAQAKLVGVRWPGSQPEM